MTCSDFLARYSEFLDGRIPDEEHPAFQTHLDGCASCQRYDRVVTRGISLLRSLPPQRLRDDFRDRLRHSVYTVEEAERLRRHRPHGATGGGAMAIVAAAVLVGAMLWTPVLWDVTPSVELPAIVAAPPTIAAESPLPGVLGQQRPSPPRSPRYDADLWTRSNHLLYEHTPLFHRHREPGMIRTGLD